MIEGFFTLLACLMFCLLNMNYRFKVIKHQEAIIDMILHVKGEKMLEINGELYRIKVERIERNE